MKLQSFILGFFIMLTAAGCGRGIPSNTIPSSATPLSPPLGRGEIISLINESVTRIAYDFPKPGNGQIILYQIKPDAFTWRFEQTTTPKTVSEWADVFPEAAFIMNGVYFHEDMMPSGWMVSRDAEVGIRQFDLNRSAIVSLSPTVEIVQSKLRNMDLGQFTEAAQSYPMIIESGQNAIEKDSAMYAARSFFGTDVEGRVYLGITRNSAISLYELAQHLLKIPIEWNEVINLDGGPSSGLVARLASHEEQLDNFVPVPNVIILTPK